jgi:hypothetical protein
VDLILGVSAYTAPLARLGKIRSAGITDLRYGNLVDEDWAGRDRFAGGGDRRNPWWTSEASLPKDRAVAHGHGDRCTYPRFVTVGNIFCRNSGLQGVKSASGTT